ncbi:MAG: glycosyltransferase [Flavobacteriales bacterium]|nr:glycosyltransferase [Flavobacteriales bacterium]
MTYNHAEKITQCLESIDAQITSFPFEVVIGDDFSTDNNMELIRLFINRSQNNNITYRILERERGGEYDQTRQKLGRLYNFINIVDHCEGKYIALLDGDDYWVDPYKLQKQVDILESNPALALVYTNAKIDSEEGGDYFGEPTFYAPDYPADPLKSQHFFLQHNYAMLVVTVMFRKRDFDEPLKETMLRFATGDFALYFMLSGKGDFYYLNEVSAAYYDHVHGESKRFSKLKRDKHNYEQMDLILPYIKQENRHLFRIYIQKYLIRSVFNIMFRKVRQDGLQNVPLSDILFVKWKHMKFRYFYYYIKLIIGKITYRKA